MDWSSCSFSFGVVEGRTSSICPAVICSGVFVSFMVCGSSFSRLFSMFVLQLDVVCPTDLQRKQVILSSVKKILN